MDQEKESTTTPYKGSRLPGRFNLIAVLVVVVLLGGFLLLLRTRQAESVSTSSTTTGSSTFTSLYVVTTGADGRTNTVLSALNFSNGRVIWQRTLDIALSSAGLSMQGNLYFPTQDGNVFAFRGRDGQPLWHSSMSHGPRDSTGAWVLPYQNLVIDSITNRTNDNGDLYALNAQTGAVVWHTTLSCAASPSNDCAAGGRLTLLANGIIYGLADDGLSAWNAGNGHFLWRNPHYLLNGQPQSMVVAHGKVYITNFYPEVDVLNARSGGFLHSLKPPEPPDSSTVVYDIAATENTVYVLGGQIVSAYRTSDDALLWKQAFHYHSGGNIFATNSGIYVNYYDISMGLNGTGGGSGTYLYALRSVNGRQLWQDQSIAGSSLYPVISNGVICVSSLRGISGLSLSEDKQLWQFSAGTYVEDLFGG